MSISTLKDKLIGSLALHTLSVTNLDLNGETFSNASQDLVVTPDSFIFGPLPPITINLRRANTTCTIQVPLLGNTAPIAGIGAFDLDLPAGLLTSLGMGTSGDRIVQTLSYVDGVYVATRASLDIGSDTIRITNAADPSGTFTVAANYSCYPFQLTYINDL